MELTEKDKKRFFSKIRIHENGCHLWVGVTDRAGYGQFKLNYRQEKAHRVAYFLHHGQIDKTLTIDHLCAYKSCVNPNHLRLVSIRENVLASNNAAAINAKKTHCKRGHEFTPENTGKSKKGRYCIKCHNTTTRVGIKIKELYRALNAEKS